MDGMVAVLVKYVQTNMQGSFTQTLSSTGKQSNASFMNPSDYPELCINMNKYNK